MAAPTTRGLHHLKLPVSDLDASIAWYERVLGAQHQPKFDHVDGAGLRYAAILGVPGCDVPLELRWAPNAARTMRGYDPVDFAAGTVADVQAWAAHLDAEGVEHSPVSGGAAGAILVFPDPDGTFLRMLELPEGGVEAIEMAPGDPEPTGPWLAPPAMRHPGQEGYSDETTGGPR